MCENGWLDGILGIGRFWHDPEALVGVVDESDDLTFGRCDRPRASEEVEGRAEKIPRWGRCPQSPESLSLEQELNEFLAWEQNSPRPKPWAEQGTQFLVLSCSGCASAEPYPSQNGLTVEAKPMQQTSRISKYSKNSTFDLTIPPVLI